MDIENLIIGHFKIYVKHSEVLATEMKLTMHFYLCLHSFSALWNFIFNSVYKK